MSDKKYDIEMMVAIRQEYKKASQNLSILTKELEIANTKLLQAENYTQEISYKQYKRLKEEVAELTVAVHNAVIIRNVWDEAREVCMNIIDGGN